MAELGQKKTLPDSHLTGKNYYEKTLLVSLISGLISAHRSNG